MKGPRRGTTGVLIVDPLVSVAPKANRSSPASVTDTLSAEPL